MRFGLLSALVVLLPAAANPALAVPRDAGIALALCGGKDSIRIPVSPDPLPGGDDTACCEKACHSSGSRKRSGGKIDSGQ